MVYGYFTQGTRTVTFSLVHDVLHLPWTTSRHSLDVDNAAPARLPWMAQAFFASRVISRL